MPDLELTEPAEEMLASLWSAKEGEDEAHPDRSGPPARDATALEELRHLGLAEGPPAAPVLTPAGEAEAAAIIRRERLAERLLTDVLDVRGNVASAVACRFEHLLRKGIDDRICTLLGHPSRCPHGRPIPPGPCCRARAGSPGRVTSPLADLAPGQSGVIAYLQTQQPELLQRLLAMGALPGAPILLRQRFPSFVVEVGHAQVALDEETARDIYVHLTAPTRVSPARHAWLPPGFGRLRRRGRRP